MKTKITDKPVLDKALSRALERAEALSESREFLAAFHAAAHSPELQDLAIKEPKQFLRSMNVKVPKGLAVTFFNRPTRGKPTPDFEFFTIRLFRCRTYWLKKIDGVGYEKVEICFGFEIVPHPIPGGPIG